MACEPRQGLDVPRRLQKPGPLRPVHTAFNTLSPIIGLSLLAVCEHTPVGAAEAGVSMRTTVVLTCVVVALLATSASADLPLPSVEVGLATPEGQRRLLDAAPRSDYFALAEHFVSQINAAFCGVASTAMVLNALGTPRPAPDASAGFVNPAYGCELRWAHALGGGRLRGARVMLRRRFLPASPRHRYWDQTNAFTNDTERVVPQAQVRKQVTAERHEFLPPHQQGRRVADTPHACMLPARALQGMSIDELSGFLAAHPGVASSFTRTQPQDVSLDAFRESIITALALPSAFVVVNFDRGVIMVRAAIGHHASVCSSQPALVPPSPPAPPRAALLAARRWWRSCPESRARRQGYRRRRHLPHAARLKSQVAGPLPPPHRVHACMPPCAAGVGQRPPLSHCRLPLGL